MILDNIENLKRYVSINPLMEKVIDYLSKNDISSLEDGKIEISGKDLFINVNTQHAMSRAVVQLESHAEYIDIQIPISGDEEMGFTPQQMLAKPCVPYNSETDVAFHPGLSNSYLEVRKGMFVIFFPGEGHAPAITENGIHKLIIKMRKS